MIGIDEVGRGCWAGPLLVVAARQKHPLSLSLKDSKKLSAKQRQVLIEGISSSCDIGEGWVEAAEVDTLGLTGAMKLAVKRALAGLNAKSDEEIIMDGNFNYCEDVFANVTCAVKADDLYPIVSAASIYAKVARDDYMAKVGKEYPGYAFESHVGYGTKSHSDAIRLLGVTKLHRVSYKPIKVFLELERAA